MRFNMNNEKLEKLSKTQFEALFVKLHSKIQEDPIKNFIEAPGFCDTVLTPGQRVLFKLVMNHKLDAETTNECFIRDVSETDGFNIHSLDMTEVELYKYLTEKEYDDTEINSIRDVTMILGRRAGKTMCASLLAIYNAIKVNWQPMLGRKKIATILVMSHTTEFSNETIGEIRSIINDSPILSRLIDTKQKNTQSTIALKVPFLDKKGNITYSNVRLRSNAASSKSSRGSACPVIIADELAFFGSDPHAKETDKEIMRAVTPSMLQFEDSAMLITLSTPNTRHGVLYEKYDNRFDLPKKCVVLKAPSWVFNNRYRSEDFYDFWKEDPENFTREFEANFVDSLSSFLNPEFIDLAVMKGSKVIPAAAKKSKVKYIAAIDAAFKGDIFTVNVVGIGDNRITQHATLGFKGTRTNPIKAYEVAKAIRELNKQYDFSVVYADQFSFQPLKEIFSGFGITLEERVFTNTFKQKIYKNLKYLLDSQIIDLLDHPATINELKEIQVEISTTGKIRIMHPPGGHDDYADSLAIAAYIAKEVGVDLGFSFESNISDDSYGVKRDIHGTCFGAPPPSVLGASYGYEVIDNSGLYTLDPETKKLVLVDEDDDDDEGGGPCFTMG